MNWQTIKKHPLTVYLFFSLASLALLTSSRVGLMLWQNERVSEADGWIRILLQGIRIDFTSLCILLAIPVLLSVLLFNNKWLLAGHRLFVKCWLTLLIFVFVFMELATPSFITEYNIRPNRLFIEYLIYPKEVFSMLIKSHLLEIIVTNVIAISIAIFTWKQVDKLVQETKPIKWFWRPVALFLSLVFLIVGSRSTMGHRPINPALVYFSTDPLVNSLILNSTYAVGFAAKQMSAEESGDSRYGHISDEMIIQTVRELKGIGELPMLDEKIPTLAEQKASNRGSRKNLVILLQESVGARFVESLGGLPLMPNIDRLSKEGWYFESMLATGTRSVRGIEAVVTGFTPTPDRAVVKLGKSQSNFFTLAELLKRQGYHTEFIYGGEAHFDNMKSFFLGNGFDHITEEKDYINPTFLGSWGVSDEDLHNKAHEKFEQFHAQGKPFFSLVFSSSNHSPFEYPEGRITPYDDVVNTRHNAIQYADWAVGDFIAKAKKSSYWDDTIFLIVADHDARTLGSALVPPKSFHIPALVLGKGIEAHRDSRLVSQLDLPVTMLSLIGVDNQNPMIGRDLTHDFGDKPGVAFMQYGENFAFLEGNQATILQPGKDALSFQFNNHDFSLSLLGSASKEQAERALAISSWGKLAYKNQYFRLPDETAVPTTEIASKKIQDE